MATFVLYLDQPRPHLPTTVHLYDERIAVHPRPNWICLGALEHNAFDHSPRIIHAVREVLARFDLHDPNLVVRVTHYERAVFYHLPESLVLSGERPQKLEVQVFPEGATASVPQFESEDDSVVEIQPCGTLIPKRPGQTRVIVRASDNPILRYEVEVTVPPPLVIGIQPSLRTQLSLP